MQRADLFDVRMSIRVENFDHHRPLVGQQHTLCLLHTYVYGISLCINYDNVSIAHPYVYAMLCLTRVYVLPMCVVYLYVSMQWVPVQHHVY